MGGKYMPHDRMTNSNSLRIGLMGVCLLLAGCSGGGGDFDGFLNEKITCPFPAVAEFEPWGKSGTQQICKIKHGPFVAWEGGYVHIRGQYEYGKESGIWNWYDKNGKIEKTIDYSK